MKKATTIRKLITLSLCLMMCLSVFAPASVFAKCSHKNTKLVVLKEVTCTRNGKCVKVCIKCGKNLKTCSVKKLGHTYKHIYIKPTCNNRGWEGTMCKRCGYSVAEKSYPALGHNYKTTVYKGTCNTPGVTVKVCKRCGDKKSYSTYAEYVKIFLDKEKVNVYNTKSMRKERLRYYEDKYIGNLI